MVTTTVRPRRTARHVDDGDVRLSTGGAIQLADISGTDWTRARLARLAARAQADMDHRRPIATLPRGDPDRARALAGDRAWFRRRYGRRMFLDGADIVSRTDKISFTFERVENEDGTLGPFDLVPRIEALF